jgi:hypothetical protein
MLLTLLRTLVSSLRLLPGWAHWPAESPWPLLFLCLLAFVVVPLLFLLTYDSRSPLINSATKSSTFPRPPMFLYDDHPLSVVLLRLYVCRIYGLYVSLSFVSY